MLDQAFFDSVRASLFGGSLTPDQMAGLNALDAAWSTHGADLPSSAEAYVFATVLNEQSAAFRSIGENLNYSAERAHQVWPGKFPTVASAKPYENNPVKLANHVYAGIIGNGSEGSGDGYRFRGRGYSQLTGRNNYAQFAKLLGIDLLNHPDLALDVSTGAAILVIGMVRGLFTGKKLSDYFGSGKLDDPVHARAIVNGDVAANGVKIAGHWQKFLTALKSSPAASTEPAAPPAPAKAIPSPDPTIKAWQKLLIDTAAKEGKPNPLPKFGDDGYGGHELQTAIISFQKSRNPPLPETGQLDDATRAALNPPRQVSTPSPALTEFAIKTAVELLVPEPAKDMILMNISLLTLIFNHINILPYLQQDVTTELKVVNSSADGKAKVLQTIAVLEDILAQAKASINDQPIPAPTAKAT